GPRAEQLRQHLLDRLALGVAVGLGLNDLCVDTERDVVHEDSVIHEGEVDRVLDPGVKGIECTDDVVAVEPEIEREVIARSCRDAAMAARVATAKTRPVTAKTASSSSAPRTIIAIAAPTRAAIARIPATERIVPRRVSAVQPAAAASASAASTISSVTQFRTR